MKIIAVIIAMVLLSAYLIEKNITCPRYGESVQLESKFDFLAGGCFVNYKGQWIPSKNLRAGQLD